MSLNVGKMRFRILIQERSTTRSATGEQSHEWATIAGGDVAASYEPMLGGSEFQASASREARVPTRFRLRWIEGVYPRMRVLFDGRWFDIKEAQDPNGLRAELILTTEELVEVPA